MVTGPIKQPVFYLFILIGVISHGVSIGNGTARADQSKHTP